MQPFVQRFKCDVHLCSFMGSIQRGASYVLVVQGSQRNKSTTSGDVLVLGGYAAYPSFSNPLSSSICSDLFVFTGITTHYPLLQHRVPTCFFSFQRYASGAQTAGFLAQKSSMPFSADLVLHASWCMCSGSIEKQPRWTQANLCAGRSAHLNWKRCNQPSDLEQRTPSSTRSCVCYTIGADGHHE